MCTAPTPAQTHLQLMSGKSTRLSYTTELNCHIANVCSGYTELPCLTVRALLDSAGYWREAAKYQNDRDRRSYLARAEALQAAARDLSYKLTNTDGD